MLPVAGRSVTPTHDLDLHRIAPTRAPHNASASQPARNRLVSPRHVVRPRSAVARVVKCLLATRKPPHRSVAPLAGRRPVLSAAAATPPAIIPLVTLSAPVVADAPLPHAASSSGVGLLAVTG